MKLVVTPHRSRGRRPGEQFTIVVRYRGDAAQITDPDTSIEGWIRACFPLNPPQTCDGAFVVNEPMGAQSWFPSNNYPTDKATFDTHHHGAQCQDRARCRRARQPNRPRERHHDLALAGGRPDRHVSDDGDRR